MSALGLRSLRRLPPKRFRPFTDVGFTLAELLIVLALSGVLAALALNLITKTPSGTYGRLAEDYARHLASVYEQYQMKNGQPFDLTTNNMASLLPTWESIAIYTSSSPELLTYPSRVIVYIKPEQVSGMSAPTLAGTNNREWVMMDVNGTAGPNSLSSSGDRVLFYIENTSGRVFNGLSKCQEDGTTTYTQSFYDIYKGY